MPHFERDPILGDLPPYFNFLILPDSEQRGSSEHISAGLSEVWESVRSFRHALRLFDFCLRDKPDENDWKMIAARDGAWSISNLGYAIQYFRSSSGFFPTLNSLINHSDLRTAQRMYEGWFPDFPHIRHALAHGPEITKSQQARDTHYYKGPFRSDGQIIDGDQTMMIVKHSLRGRIYQTTFEARLLTYEISKATLTRLVQIKDKFFGGFRAVEQRSLQTPHWRDTK